MQRLRRIWNKARRGTVYALLLLSFVLLQDVILSNIAPLGVRSVFVPALVMAVGLFEGGWRGGVFGLAAGVVMDLSGTAPRLLFTVFLPLSGFTLGFLTEFLLNRRLYVYCAAAAAVLFLSAFFQMLPLLGAHPESAAALWRTCLLQTLWGLPFMFPAYYACRALPRRLR